MGWHKEHDDWDYKEPMKPGRVEGGMKTSSEQGAIGSTWWSKRWIGVLESFSMGTRLTRGQSYARQGQIISMDIEAGIVKASVQGAQPRPYTIKIQLKPLSDQDWEKVTEAMASQAIFAAKLLAGEMPVNIEEAFGAVKLSLFPVSAKDLETDCTCPDWANPCKHTAAVYYLLAERFDEDPFLIFKLRGRTKDEIVQALREKRTETLPAESTLSSAESDAAEAIIPLEDHLDMFWQAGEELETFTVNPAAPRIDKAVLKRLGDAPFMIEGQNMVSLLSRAYDMVDAYVLRETTEEDRNYSGEGAGEC